MAQQKRFNAEALRNRDGSGLSIPSFKAYVDDSLEYMLINVTWLKVKSLPVDVFPKHPQTMFEGRPTPFEAFAARAAGFDVLARFFTWPECGALLSYGAGPWCWIFKSQP